VTNTVKRARQHELYLLLEGLAFIALYTLAAYFAAIVRIPCYCAILVICIRYMVSGWHFSRANLNVLLTWLNLVIVVLFTASLVKL
jgi:hypothetical protein